MSHIQRQLKHLKALIANIEYRRLQQTNCILVTEMTTIIITMRTKRKVEEKKEEVVITHKDHDTNVNEDKCRDCLLYTSRCV